ncbi:MAG: GAF domain-containing sensor histidine kinase [Chloroflexota bacterium]
MTSEADARRPGHTKRTLDQLSRLVDLSVRLNSTLDLDSLLQIIIHTAADLLGCETASILLYDEKKPHLFFAATSGPQADQLKQLEVPMEGSLAGTVFRTNRAIIINDAQKDPRHYGFVAKKTGMLVHSLMGVPMRIRDRLTGVLEAINKRGGEFDSGDELILSVIASHAAVAVNNARLVNALQKALDRVKEADRLKEDFLALASHELRTPLGIIIGYATFLREDAQGELSEHAEHVLNASLQLRSLIDDMTNLRLLETDGLNFRPQQLAVQVLLDRACKSIRLMADSKAQKLMPQYTMQPLMVNVDPEKMNAALSSVLNNAVRFSPVGGEIRVGARADANGVLVWVEDDGEGIPEDQLDTIFQEFRQGEPPNTRRYGGLGIGLTIARGLIEAQGGRIWAESDGAGKGARFNILLPGPVQVSRAPAKK